LKSINFDLDPPYTPLKSYALPITLETLVGRRGAGSKGERRKNHSS